MTESSSTIWTQAAVAPKAGGAGRSEADVADWRQLTSRTAALATANGWSKAEVARRSGMAEGTFSQWFSGTYAGRFDTQNERIRQWLDTAEEMAEMARGIPASPPFFETKTSREIMETLLYAQMLPEIAVIVLGAGMGKTTTAEQFCATRPHAYLVTMTPNTRTCHGMLVEIAAALGVTQHNPAKLHRAIGERLQRNGRQCLLIIDEAQNLVDQAVNQLRSFHDINECGIALIGNKEIYGRFAGRSDGPSYAQIKRRIGKRLNRTQPYAEDIAAQIDAWGVRDEEARKFLTGIGHKPGALGEIDKTLRLAGIAAGGDYEAITVKHIRAAWANRGAEE
jgi:DNA transposition AAA+ family ATPase